MFFLRRVSRRRGRRPSSEVCCFFVLSFFFLLAVFFHVFSLSALAALHLIWGHTRTHSHMKVNVFVLIYFYPEIICLFVLLREKAAHFACPFFYYFWPHFAPFGKWRFSHTWRRGAPNDKGWEFGEWDIGGQLGWQPPLFGTTPQSSLSNLKFPARYDGEMGK